MSPSRRTRRLLYFLIVVLAAILIAGCQPKPVLEHGTVYNNPSAAPLLALKTTDGSDFSLGQLRGKTTLVYFGYANCPDFCPATLATLDWMLDELGERGDQVQVVFVSVDPERDSPEILEQYLDGFHPGTIGLTGDPASLKTALDGYGAMASTTHDLHPEEEGIVAHTTRLFVVDPEGRLRANYPFDVDRQDLLEDISGLLDITAGSS
jgi:protein SCO1/2